MTYFVNYFLRRLSFLQRAAFRIEMASTFRPMEHAPRDDEAFWLQRASVPAPRNIETKARTIITGWGYPQKSCCQFRSR
jgi:hypothetical protein